MDLQASGGEWPNRCSVRIFGFSLLNLGRQPYTYDQLNRLKSASESGGANPWTQTYLYDDTTSGQQGGRYGNRRIDASQTTANVQPASNPTFDLTTNRIAAGQNYSYDRAGNVITDPSYSYTYDAENRMVSSVDGNCQPYSDQKKIIYAEYYTNHLLYLFLADAR